ncbi:MAG TPA: PEP-CTERM sorting domain-containing protein [Verrucomicrobiae bacterium]|jgi:hypothetical protein|nr:PEP-CTERM sorting domain-containing protein [Verrucomicrobiae bacterium]
MKKQIAILAAIFVAGGLSAFGQGYVNFTTGGGFVYDEFTTPGSDVASSATVDVTFLWATTGATDLFGTGVATTGSNSGATGFGELSTMLSSGWSIAYNVGGASPVEAQVLTSSSGLAKGGINYSSSFALGTSTGADSTAGGTYQFVVVGWNAAAGSTLEAAMADASAFGWSSSFQYASGASSSSPVSALSSSGLSKFGVAPVPEPTTLALAGLGGLSMLFLRRRKA